MNLKTVIKNISVNLKELRIKNKLTQQELSFNLNMDRRGYQNLESGFYKNIKLSTILKILDYYNIKLDDLLK